MLIMYLKRIIICIIIAILFIVIDINKVDSYKDTIEVTDIILDLEMPEVMIEEKILDVRYGDLTGYSADCPLCNGTLACKRDYKVYRNGVTNYNDSTYGEVRIVASSKNLACGSIIKFSSSVTGDDTYAIVLDRGVLGNDLDLLVESESYASEHVGRSKIRYSVLRNGW